MKTYRCRAYVMTLLTLSLVIPGVSAAQSNQDSGRGMSQIDSATSGVHDFDFLVGHWRVHHRKLQERLANSCPSPDWGRFMLMRFTKRRKNETERELLAIL